LESGKESIDKKAECHFQKVAKGVSGGNKVIGRMEGASG